MVRHSVYFWLDDSLDDDDRLAFEDGMRTLFAIDAVRDGRFGRPAETPERDVTHNTFDYALVLDFDSVEQHDAYQAHHDHGVFVDRFSDWFEEVRVFDTQF